MADINELDIQLLYQKALSKKLSERKSSAIVAGNTATKKGETINVQQEVEELKQLRVSATGFEEYIKRKAAFKAYLKTTYGNLYNTPLR